MSGRLAVSLITMMLVSVPLAAGAGTNLNSSKSNVNRSAACKGKPDGAKVKLEGKNFVCKAGIAVTDPGVPGDKGGGKKNK